MKKQILTVLIMAGLAQTTHANDLIKILNAVNDGIQQAQQQQYQQQNGGGKSYKYKQIDPYSSGRQNFGNGGNYNYNNGGRGNPNSSGNFNNGGYTNNHRFFQNSTPTYSQPAYNRYNTVPSYNNSSHSSYSTPSSFSSTPTYGSSRVVYNTPPIAPKVYSKLPISIKCPQGTYGTCSYELVSASGKVYPYTIRSGQTQHLSETTDWSIRYRPTSSSARKTYRLDGGQHYQLQKSGDSWAFYTAR